MRMIRTAMMAVAAGAVTAGCHAGKGTEAAPSAASSTSSASLPPGAARPEISGAHKTINDYINEAKIAETPIRPDEPGTPKFDFPFPPGWSDAGDKTPEWAYGAIVYDQPVDPADPPAMIAIASKLTGDVDPARILEYAPGQLENLPDFAPIGDPEKSKLGGFEAVESSGTYTFEGKARVIAQKTVVIPANGAWFALQLNADAPQGQEDVVIDAARFIDEQTKITAP